MLPAAAAEHYRSQQRQALLAITAARRVWAAMPADFDAGWRSLAATLTALTAAAQLGAALQGVAYVPAVLAETGQADDPVADVDPEAFAGIASDGRDLEQLLYSSVTTAKGSVAAGGTVTEALLAGRSWLDLAIQTIVADAARTAAGVAITARPSVSGYVRMLNTPSCSRCVVLAGKFFRWNKGFARHPRCDCRHVPASENVAGDLRTDPLEAIKAGQVTGLSAADHRAIIDDGADVGQVVNARRGMYQANAYGSRVSATQEGVTRRGVAGKQLLEQGVTYKRTPRLRPESIYQIAGDDRGEAIRLLTRFGYLI